jgi:putative transposase
LEKVWCLSLAARLSLVDRSQPDLPIAAQCRLLKVARSTLYYRPLPVSADDLRLMRWLDEQFLQTPFYGSRRMVAVMRRDGFVVNRKRVKRLMRVMGIEAIYQKPNTSLAHPAHKVYPYLLRGLLIDRPNQVWCADITYVPMAKGFVYLVAVMDWFSRRVLSWRLSITMDSDFCVAALREAMEQHGRPEIFNTDQGVQFTSADFLAGLEAQAVRISMDGKGRYLGRVDDWRGGGRSRGELFSGGFHHAGALSIRTVAPFPVAARQTGHADFPHPAFSHPIRPSLSAGRCVAVGR